MFPYYINSCFSHYSLHFDSGNDKVDEIPTPRGVREAEMLVKQDGSPLLNAVSSSSNPTLESQNQKAEEQEQLEVHVQANVHKPGEQKYQKGEHIEAQYEGKPEWYPGKHLYRMKIFLFYFLHEVCPRIAFD